MSPQRLQQIFSGCEEGLGTESRRCIAWSWAKNLACAMQGAGYWVYMGTALPCPHAFTLAALTVSLISRMTDDSNSDWSSLSTVCGLWRMSGSAHCKYWAVHSRPQPRKGGVVGVSVLWVRELKYNSHLPKATLWQAQGQFQALGLCSVLNSLCSELC